MALTWTQRREELLSDCIVSPDVFKSYVASHIRAAMWRSQLCGEKGICGNSTALLAQAAPQ
jgi:hypothetical protein